MKEIEKELTKNGQKDYAYFIGNKSLSEYEKQFKQGVFDFPEEPIKDCFCKI